MFFNCLTFFFHLPGQSRGVDHSSEERRPFQERNAQCRSTTCESKAAEKGKKKAFQSTSGFTQILFILKNSQKQHPAKRLMPNGVICDTRNLEAKGYGFITPDAGKRSYIPYAKPPHHHSQGRSQASILLSRFVPSPCLLDSRSEKWRSAMQVGTTCTLT